MPTIAEKVPVSKPALSRGRVLSGLVILFLLCDGAIKLVPWPVVTETMDRIGYGSSETLARGLGQLSAFENRYQARFLTPFEAHNTAEFTMLPQGNATNVTWLMHGAAPFMSKLMQVFINLDNKIGKDFEAGLANLKRLAEK